MQVAAYTAGQRHAICNLHDAEQVLFGRGASAPGRSVKLGRWLDANKSVKEQRGACPSASNVDAAVEDLGLQAPDLHGG
jgi:hypothetical protein